MAKDPAINWYFDNWLGGTKGMNRLQKACYFDLLTAQYYIGHLTLLQIKNELGPDFHVWETIKGKFKEDESGNLYSARMDTEIKKRAEFSKKQADKIKKRWEKEKSGTYTGNTTVLPKYETGTETILKEKGEASGKMIILYPIEDENDFADLQKWIANNCPDLLHWKQPFTIEDHIRAKHEFDMIEVKRVLTAMYNMKGSEKKYKSVNLTMRNWIQRSQELKQERQTKNNTNYGKQTNRDQRLNEVDDLLAAVREVQR
jgi:hypothetical protein